MASSVRFADAGLAKRLDAHPLTMIAKLDWSTCRLVNFLLNASILMIHHVLCLSYWVRAEQSRKYYSDVFVLCFSVDWDGLYADENGYALSIEGLYQLSGQLKVGGKYPWKRSGIWVQRGRSVLERQ